jgi:putative ABC transport system permease protein
MKWRRPDSLKLYSWLLRLSPARFREEYQTPMVRQFRDEYRETVTARGRFGFWIRVVLDLAGSLPVEIARELRQDLLQSVRVYRRRSFTTALAVVALALAIGVSTGVFSVLNSLLGRALPFAEPERLVELLSSPFGPGRGRAAFLEWQGQSTYLESAAGFSVSEMNLIRDRDALRVKVAETSANFFQLLGARPAAGRTFSGDEDRRGRAGVAVISHALWQQQFGGDPRTPGATIHLNGQPLVIAGVAPARFDYPGDVSIWLPSVFDPGMVPKHGAFVFRTIGRLKPGIPMQQALDRFEAEVRGLAPERLAAHDDNRARMVSLRNQLAGPVRQAGWVLAGMILLVLLTACANVAQLLLSRATERRQEMAIRAALGASRARLAQQLITEATVLTATAAALGLLVAHWTVSIASSIAPSPLAAQQYTLLDWRVPGFAMLLALMMGVAFGVLPLLLAGRLHESGQMVRTQPGVPDPAARRFRLYLIASQAGLAMTLLACSLTMGRTFQRLLDVDLGFRPANVVTLTVSLNGTRYQENGTRWQYYSAALERLGGVPGVETAGAVSYLPLVNSVLTAGTFELDSGQTVPTVVTNATMPGYFGAMGATFLQGRDFTATERQQAERAVIVNEAFARAAGLEGPILGRGLKAPWSQTPFVIVGVVSTARFAGPAFPGIPQVFWPVEEDPPPALTFAGRVRGRADAVLPAFRDALRSVDPGVPVYDAKTLEQRLADVLARPKFYTTAILFLTALAVLLASAGVYGAAHFSVANQEREIGIRMALGASAGRIRGMILRENLGPMVIGLAGGTGGAIAAGQYLGHLVVNAAPPGLGTCAAAAALLALMGFGAVWTATARVLSIDPADAVRAE